MAFVIVLRKMTMPQQFPRDQALFKALDHYICPAKSQLPALIALVKWKTFINKFVFICLQEK